MLVIAGVQIPAPMARAAVSALCWGTIGALVGLVLPGVSMRRTAKLGAAFGLLRAVWLARG
jgi:hypothetical protein